MDLSEMEDPERMMVKAIHEGSLETVADILRNNTDIFMKKISTEKGIQGNMYY